MKRSVIAICLLFAGALHAQDSVQTITLGQVVVTGQYEPQSLRQSVFQVRTISSDLINARSATSVQGVLNTELGIRFSNDLILGTSDISIMGMSGQNVKVLLDGVPLLDRGATRESLNQIDVNSIERIEIVEGPLSVIYGSDALAGVINIITKKGAGNGKGIAVRARIVEESTAGEYKPFSGDGTHNENVSVNWQGERWYTNASATRNQFGGLQGNKTGRQQEWLPKNQLFGMGTVGMAGDKVDVWYRLNYLNETLESPGAVNVNTGEATDKEYRTHRFTHQLQADWSISSRWNFNAVASFQDYSRRTQTSLYNSTTGNVFLSPDQGTQDKSEFTSTTLRGSFLHKVSEKVSWQPGFDVNLHEGMGDRIDQRRSIADYALFASAEIKPVSVLNIRPGVRFLYNSVYDAPPVVPSINIKLGLSPSLDLRAAYAKGFRAPALRELYFYFFDSSHSIIGNPDLKAEHSNSLSASLAWHRPLTTDLVVDTNLGGFYNQFDDMITLGVDPDDSGINTYINVADYKTTGGTLTQSVHYRKLYATVGFAYIGVYNEFADSDASLPELMWTPELNASVQYRFEKSGTSLSGYYKFTGKRSGYEYADGGSSYNLATRDSFHWVDVMANQRITGFIDLVVGVRNLLNVTRLQNTSLDIGGSHSTGGPIPMSFGRSFVAGLNFNLH